MFSFRTSVFNFGTSDFSLRTSVFFSLRTSVFVIGQEF